MLTKGIEFLEGPAGAIEVVIDNPTVAQPKGLVVNAHPQPLLGGSAQHKIPHFLAKGFAEEGWLVVRPNFRGVGASAGSHDYGEGETQDMLELVKQFRAKTNLPLVLVGFSFGAYVQAKVAKILEDLGEPAQTVCLAGMPYGEVEGGRFYDTPQGIQNALVIHGELDERVPLKSVFEWATPDNQVVTVVPGADHFFAGRLPILRKLIIDFVTIRNKQ